MKSSTFFSLIAIVAVFGLVVRVDACGPSSYGQSNVCRTNTSPYPPYPTASMSPFAPVANVSSNVAGATPLSASQSHLTVVPTTSESTINRTAVVSNSSPSASLHVVSDEQNTVISKPAPKADPAASNPSASNPAANAVSSTIADGLKGLVGTWMAVARHGDGELTTIELQLDKSGWAKLTVPGADGKPSTTTRQVEFNNGEIKLTGADADLALGKLVESSSRQFVLDRADGQVTFVRP